LEAWKRQFIRDLFPYSASRMHIERAFAIKHANLPSRLYKYRRFSKEHFDALRRNVLWLSSPDRLNDPYEASVSFDLDRFSVEDRTPQEFLDFMTTRKKTRRRSKPQPLVRPIRSDQWRRRIFSELAEEMEAGPKEALLTYIEAFFKQYHEEQIRRMSDAFRRGFSVLSMSENCSSTLMWAHYSDGHKGFCIEYDLSSLPPDDLLRRFVFLHFIRRNDEM
jgi:hypothetical protein